MFLSQKPSPKNATMHGTLGMAAGGARRTGFAAGVSLALGLVLFDRLFAVERGQRLQKGHFAYKALHNKDTLHTT